MEATCPACRAVVAAGTRYCPNCGAFLTGPLEAAPVAGTATGDVASAPSADFSADGSPSRQLTSQLTPAARARPTGVTVLGILAYVFGGLALAGAVVMLFVMTIFGAAFGSMFGAPDVGGGWGAVLGAVVAFFLGLFGALYLVLGHGLMNGRGWAWVLALVLAALSLVSFAGRLASPFGMFGGSPMAGLGGLPSALLAGFVLWYFLKPEVKAWFGRAA